jgi:cation-dependent mannose-6-phosphate receptor
LTHHSILIAILTWFGGHTLYNRFFLHRRGLDQFPLPRCSAPKLSLGGNSDGERPARSWGFRRSQRGYNHLRTEPDEEDSLAAARFSLEDEDDEDDARALGGEVNAWRGHTPRRSSDDGDRPRVGAHQGLVDL